MAPLSSINVSNSGKGGTWGRGATLVPHQVSAERDAEAPCMDNITEGTGALLVSNPTTLLAHKDSPTQIFSFLASPHLIKRGAPSLNHQPSPHYLSYRPQ